MIDDDVRTYQPTVIVRPNPIGKAAGLALERSGGEFIVIRLVEEEITVSYDSPNGAKERTESRWVKAKDAPRDPIVDAIAGTLALYSNRMG